MDEFLKFLSHLETLANDPAVEAKLAKINAIIEKVFAAAAVHPPSGSG